MKKMKSIIAVTLMAIIMLSSTRTAFAATSVLTSSTGVTPFWDNTNTITVALSVDGSTATCSAVVEGYSGTTKIVADITLERKNSNGTYTAVKKWTNQSASAARLFFNDTYSVASGYTYRLTVTAKVTRNGTIETASNWVEN